MSILEREFSNKDWILAKSSSRLMNLGLVVCKGWKGFFEAESGISFIFRVASLAWFYIDSGKVPYRM